MALQPWSSTVGVIGSFVTESGAFKMKPLLQLPYWEPGVYKNGSYLLGRDILQLLFQVMKTIISPFSSFPNESPNLFVPVEIAEKIFLKLLGDKGLCQLYFLCSESKAERGVCDSLIVSMFFTSAVPFY